MSPTLITIMSNACQFEKAAAQSGVPPRSLRVPAAYAIGTIATIHNDAIVATTPSTKSTTSRPVCLRALSWLVKKSVDMLTPSVRL